MIIDFHTHIFPHEVLESRDSYMDDPGFKLLYSADKSTVIDQPGLTEYIADNGLSGAAAMSFPWYGEKYSLCHNEYMASISGESNIFPFGIIPLSGSKSVRVYAEDIKKSGLYGIGEIAFYNGGMSEPNLKFLREVLEASVEFSLPVCLHVNEPLGHGYTGKYQPSLAALYELLKSIPDAAVVLAHWGGGLLFYELMPEVREVLKNVYYDTAATPYLYRSDIYSTAVKIAGAEKIIFGSDYPLLGVNRYKNSIDKEIDSSRDRDKIFGENARRVLGI